jgi:hypothetical protein
VHWQFLGDDSNCLQEDSSSLGVSVHPIVCIFRDDRENTISRLINEATYSASMADLTIHGSTATPNFYIQCKDEELHIHVNNRYDACKIRTQQQIVQQLQRKKLLAQGIQTSKATTASF